MQKIVVVIMGQNCERFIGMCLDSVKNADAIIYCDGGSNDMTLNYVNTFIVQETRTHQREVCSIIENEYNQLDKGMNGKQRNFYLKYVKKNYPDWWCLALDADEIVEDFSKVKEFIQKAHPGLYNVHIRHLIQDLAHEDATTDKHWVPFRLFKISEADKYPETEHPVLTPKWRNIKMKHHNYNHEDKEYCRMSQTDCTTIWHLAHIPGLWDIKKRYENHMKKSEMHTPEFLKNWYWEHLFGVYPRKEFDPVELPIQLLKKFNINKDELYFRNRGIELKHSIMVKNWHDYFKPKTVLDLGCGKGPYMFYWKWLVDDTKGIEISDWAVKHAFVNDIIKGDISKEKEYTDHDLITAIDVLEHLNDSQLDRTLINMANYGRNFIFSMPFPGDPNLLADKTHKQFRTKGGWVKIIESHGIKIKDTPDHWLFEEQMLVGEKV